MPDAHRIPGEGRFSGNFPDPECIDWHGLRQPGDMQAGGMIRLMAPGKPVILGKYGANFHL